MVSNMHETPSSLGFRMPAEWEKHTATWLAWPHHKADWPGKFGPIPWVFTEIARYITQSENLRLLVKDNAAKAEARKHLAMANVDLDKVQFFEIPTNRGWMRDCGPIFLKNRKGEKAFLNFRFNGWAKYRNHQHDNNVPAGLNKKLKLREFIPVHKGKQVVMEGGAIEVNGRGTVIVTEECLQSKIQERNPGFSKGDYEQVFADYLGADNTIWLGKGIVGDDTHGHIDDITRFANADTIITVVEQDKKDANQSLLRNNLKILRKTKFDVIEIPMPKPVIFDGTRLPASYANFLITNKFVLVPTFNDANDRVALNILAEVFPKHEIIGIHAVDLVWGLGTIHCLTQQEPA